MDDAIEAPITLTLTTPRRMRAGRVAVWGFEAADLPPGPFRLTARSRLLARPVEAILTAGAVVHAEARMQREAGEGVVELTLESSAAASERGRWVGQAQIELAPAREVGSIDIAPTLSVAEGAMAIDPSLAVHLPHSGQEAHIRIAPRWDLAEWGVADRPSLRVSFEEADGRDGHAGHTRTVTLRPVSAAQRPASGDWSDHRRQAKMPGCRLVQAPLGLCLRTSSSPDRVFRLQLGDLLTLGRDPRCHVCLVPPGADPDLHRLSHLSAVAAEVCLEVTGASVRSLNRNGALLDGEAMGKESRRLCAQHSLHFPAPGGSFEVVLDSLGDHAARVITAAGQSHTLWCGELDLETALESGESPGPPITLIHREGHLWLQPLCGEVTVQGRRATRRLEPSECIALPRQWRADGDGWWVEGRTV